MATAVVVLLSIFVAPALLSALSDPSPSQWAAVGLGALAIGSLSWQSDHLDRVAAIIAVACLGNLLLVPMVVPAVYVAGLVVVLGLSARARATWAWGSALALVIWVWLAALRPGARGDSTALEAGIVATVMTSLVVVAAILGQLRRARIAELEGMRESVRRAEVERAQAQQIAVLTERARIAREMHDIVSHSVSGLVALADGGRYAAAEDPAAAQSALAEISDAGRRTLTDLRSLLATLRDPDASTTSPMPGVGDVHELIAQAAKGGLDVALAERGTPQTVTSGVGLAAYRVVQESLTNVVKHAGLAARAAVLMEWEPATLTVTVLDDGTGLTSSRIELHGTGVGLIGMRERVEALGGELRVGARPLGGFEVVARLPISPGSDE